MVLQCHCLPDVLSCSDNCCSGNCCCPVALSFVAARLAFPGNHNDGGRVPLLERSPFSPRAAPGQYRGRCALLSRYNLPSADHEYSCTGHILYAKNQVAAPARSSEDYISCSPLVFAGLYSLFSFDVGTNLIAVIRKL